MIGARRLPMSGGSWWDYEFESLLLHQGVSCEPNFLPGAAVRDREEAVRAVFPQATIGDGFPSSAAEWWMRCAVRARCRAARPSPIVQDSTRSPRTSPLIQASRVTAVLY